MNPPPLRVVSETRANGVTDPLPAAPAPKSTTAPAAKRGRSFTDLAALAANLKGERDWLFEGIVEGRPIAVWVGPEKRDKSWCMIDGAIAVATGGPWLGSFECKRPGPAIYLDGEYGPHEFSRRFARVCRGRGLRPEDVAPSVSHYYSRDLRLEAEDEAVNWVLREARRIRPAIIFVDPWRNHLPGEENSTPDTLAALHICAVLRDETDAAILITHHLNRAGTQSGARALLTRSDLIFEGTDTEEPWYSSRGRTIRRADPINRRFTIAIEHDEDGDDTIARTRVGLRFEGEKTTSHALSKTAIKVFAAVKGGAATSNEIKRASGVTNGTAVADALEQLRSKGLVARQGTRWGLTFDSLPAAGEEEA